METYTDYKAFVPNPHYGADKQATLDGLDVDLIDFPLIKLVNDINIIPYLFTLQCCHGHFIGKDGKEIVSFESLDTDDWIEYRLAYIALCIENSTSGRKVRNELMNIPETIDRDNIQFCSAQWFWEQWLNSYAIQVMPKRFRHLDTAQIERTEARRIAKIRDSLFVLLEDYFASLLFKKVSG